MVSLFSLGFTWPMDSLGDTGSTWFNLVSLGLTWPLGVTWSYLISLVSLVSLSHLGSLVSLAHLLSLGTLQKRTRCSGDDAGDLYALHVDLQLHVWGGASDGRKRNDVVGLLRSSNIAVSSGTLAKCFHPQHQCKQLCDPGCDTPSGLGSGGCTSISSSSIVSTVRSRRI